MISPEKLKRMAVYHPAAYESYMAVVRARQRYPGVTRFDVDHSGPELVARPARLSLAEQQQERLSRRLRELRAQEERSLTNRLRDVQRTL